MLEIAGGGTKEESSAWRRINCGGEVQEMLRVTKGLVVERVLVLFSRVSGQRSKRGNRLPKVSRGEVISKLGGWWIPGRQLFGSDIWGLV